MDNPTLNARFVKALEAALPDRAQIFLSNVHVIGPFNNTDLAGLFTAYMPEKEIDLLATYPGKHGGVTWQHAAAYEGAHAQPVELAPWFAAEKDIVVYLYAEVSASDTRLASLSLEGNGMASAWANNSLVLSPTIPEAAYLQDHACWLALQPGVNRILVKACFSDREHKLGLYMENAGKMDDALTAVGNLESTTAANGIRLLAHMTRAEICGVSGQVEACQRALQATCEDPYATIWDVAWAEAIRRQYADTGQFTPFHEPAVKYHPVAVPPYPEFWPQSSPPAGELLVVDVSHESASAEFALTVLQGLVNRTLPRLYVLHTRYARQDRQWLDELHLEGYTSREVSIAEVWQTFKTEVSGAVIYDGGIMEEIGEFHSDQLNQTNILMMVAALRNAVPLTPEMNAVLNLPVVFDGRGQWTDQYDMMRWAYLNLFPHMNQRILATNYPGIFLITDYLVANRIFTFWFPEHRTALEENLLRGILASTPPNSPILGWWFDWMPNVKEPQFAHADAVMESPGLLRGSYFGKILTPSHEATNLTVHSGVPLSAWRHKLPDVPVFDPGKVYYTFVISDGDNLGEALMMRTRDLQWDKPERGMFPMGWSFAPATSRLAPPVLNYYLRTASANDLLMGGLGVGYTEPMIYLRAFPEEREELWAHYARSTDRAVGWIDSTCLWLIDGRHEEADRYARGSSGHLKGIFIGYGGEPEIAEARITSNNVVAFYPPTRFMYGKTRQEQVRQMVDDIRAATHSHPDFIEAWVLNWGLEMSMLQEVQDQLGPEYICVRPDVLVDLRLQAAQQI